MTEAEQVSTTGPEPEARVTARRRLLVEAVLTVAISVAASFAVSVVVTLGFGGFESFGLAALGGIAREAVGSPPILLWVAGVVAVTLIGRRSTTGRRTVWVIVSAVAAAIMGAGIRFWPAIATSGPFIVVAFAIPVLVGIGWFIVVAVAGRLLAVELLARRDRRAGAGTGSRPEAPVDDRSAPDAAMRTPPRPARVFVILGIAGAWVAALLLAQQWFTAYFSLFGIAPEITPEQDATYLITAGAATAFAVAAVVIAWIRRTAFVGAIVSLIGVIAIAFIMQVPMGRFWLEVDLTDPAPMDEPREPCFGEGPACIGG